MFPIVMKWNFIRFQIFRLPKIACSFQFPHLFFALLGGAEKFPSPWPLQRKQGAKPNGKMNDGGPHFSPVPSRNKKSPRTLKRQAGQLTRAENSPESPGFSVLMGDSSGHVHVMLWVKTSYL